MTDDRPGRGVEGAAAGSAPALAPVGADVGAPGAALLLAGGSAVTLLGAHEPYGLWPFAFAVVPLLVAAVARWPAGAGRLGLASGTVAYLVMLRWLVLPAGVLAWVLLSLVMGAWTAAFARLVRPWAAGERAAPWWALPAVGAFTWTGIAFLRTHHPFSGFGWATLDLAHATGSPWLGLARTTGGAGLEALTVAVGLLALVALGAPPGGGARPRTGTPAAATGAGDRRTTAARAAGSAAGLLVAGLVVALVVPTPSTSGTLETVVVQGNPFETSTLTARDEDTAIVVNLRDETRRALADAPADLVVWPEYAVDRDVTRARNADLAVPLAAAADDVALAGGRLAVGARREQPGEPVFANTLVVVPPGALVDTSAGPAIEAAALDAASTYTKRRPVPFGEYVPFRHLLGGYPPLAAQVPRDAVAGSASTVEVADGVHAAVLVCFETIYRDLTRSNLAATPDGRPGGLILAVTNDASYGRSAESAQHVAQTRLRAVESGRWAVHAALSGTSAVVDADGRVLATTDLFTVDHLRASIPVATGRTPFLVTGDLVGNTSALAAIALLALRLRGRVARQRRQHA